MYIAPACTPRIAISLCLAIVLMTFHKISFSMRYCYWPARCVCRSPLLHLRPSWSTPPLLLFSLLLQKRLCSRYTWFFLVFLCVFFPPRPVIKSRSSYLIWSVCAVMLFTPNGIWALQTYSSLSLCRCLLLFPAVSPQVEQWSNFSQLDRSAVSLR